MCFSELAQDCMSITPIQLKVHGKQLHKMIKWTTDSKKQVIRASHLVDGALPTGTLRRTAEGVRDYKILMQNPTLLHSKDKRQPSLSLLSKDFSLCRQDQQRRILNSWTQCLDYFKINNSLGNVAFPHESMWFYFEAGSGTYSVDQAKLKLRDSSVCLLAAGTKCMCHQARSRLAIRAMVTLRSGEMLLKV